jgi:hypothetical protein
LENGIPVFSIFLVKTSPRPGKYDLGKIEVLSVTWKIRPGKN